MSPFLNPKNQAPQLPHSHAFKTSKQTSTAPHTKPTLNPSPLNHEESPGCNSSETSHAAPETSNQTSAPELDLDSEPASVTGSASPSLSPSPSPSAFASPSAFPSPSISSSPPQTTPGAQTTPEAQTTPGAQTASGAQDPDLKTYTLRMRKWTMWLLERESGSSLTPREYSEGRDSGDGGCKGGLEGEDGGCEGCESGFKGVPTTTTVQDTMTAQDSMTARDSTTARDMMDFKTAQDSMTAKDFMMAKDTMTVRDFKMAKDTMTAKDLMTARDTISRSRDKSFVSPLYRDSG